MSEQNTNLLTRLQIAARAAQDMEDGWLVNLGIGMPTMIPAFIPKDRDVMFHSENGLIGMGPQPAEGEADQDLISAGKELVTMDLPAAPSSITRIHSPWRAADASIAPALARSRSWPTAICATGACRTRNPAASEARWTSPPARSAFSL